MISSDIMGSFVVPEKVLLTSCQQIMDSPTCGGAVHQMGDVVAINEAGNGREKGRRERLRQAE